MRGWRLALATPPVVEDCQRRITHIDTEIGILERESLTGGDYRERLEELRRSPRPNPGWLSWKRNGRRRDA